MNYQETIDRLEKKQDQLLNDNATYIPERTFFGRTTPAHWDWNYGSSKEKKIWWMIDDLKKSYQKSFASAINSAKIDEEFKDVEGFEKQKEDVKGLLMFQNYAKAKNISSPNKGRIICFVGPPGVGKTYFAEKLAAATGRKFFRINVAGQTETNLIMGGKTEHVGAKVGQIIEAIRKTDSRDPVVLIDEVEKAGDKRGDEGGIKNALLHVLDPEQNKEFTDTYIDVAVDISEITFVLTANDEDKIPGPLKHRLEIINLKGYNETQKINIGKIIIDKTFKENYGNANRALFEMEEGALKALIEKNKDEEGVRQLKRRIEEIIRWCFSQWAQMHEKGETETKIVIDAKKVEELIPEKKKEDTPEDKLRKKIEDLEQENENLRQKPVLQLLKPLTISENKEFCDKHQKDTLQTAENSCCLCELEEQINQIEAVISKENLEVWEKIWKKQKVQWTNQSIKLQNGSEEEKELARQIKSKIRSIEQKIQSVRKTISTKPQKDKKVWPWIVGGGLVIVYVGFLYGWLLAKKFGKKKRRKKSQLVKK